MSDKSDVIPNSVIAAKIAVHQARIDLLVPSINAQQTELVQRQGAVAALQELLAIDADTAAANEGTSPAAVT